MNAWCDAAATLCVFSFFPFLFRSLTSSPLARPFITRHVTPSARVVPSSRIAPHAASIHRYLGHTTLPPLRVSRQLDFDTLCVTRLSPPPATPYTNPRLLPNVTRLLLEHGADINVWIDCGSTTLHVAVSYGRVEVVRVLLEHGANLDAEDNKGRTSLYDDLDH